MGDFLQGNIFEIQMEIDTMCVRDWGHHSQKYRYNIFFACFIGKLDSSHEIQIKIKAQILKYSLSCVITNKIVCACICMHSYEDHNPWDTVQSHKIIMKRFGQFILYQIHNSRWKHIFNYKCSIQLRLTTIQWPFSINWEK